MNTHTRKYKSPYTRGDSTTLCLRVCTLFLLLCAFCLPLSAVAAPTPRPTPTPRPRPTPFPRPTPPPSCNAAPSPDPVIAALAADAYIWGLGPEFIQRFSKYNTIISQPFNKFVYNPLPAAWNNQATNAGDASVLYLSAFVNFDETPELVLTVPPTINPANGMNQYYVVAYYDAYGNTIGSIGIRTTPSNSMTSYLLVGPTSQYARSATVNIHGYVYRVMASDTNINWFLIRVLANTLIEASEPTSVPQIIAHVQDVFALNTLREFELNGNQPVYPRSFITPPATQEEIREAAPFQNLPKCAVEFFNQLGDAVVTNPIPNVNTGLSGTPLADLPSYMAQQYGATNVYRVPSYGQKATLDLFAPLGLTKNGFRIPHNWGPLQLESLQAGYEQGQEVLTNFIHSFNSDECTNFWGILNDKVGTYPNTADGYLFRSLIVIEGGVANIAPDAVYPTLASIATAPPNGTPPPLDGNNTYKITFVLPTPGPSPQCSPANPQWPVSGIYPPMFPDSPQPTPTPSPPNPAGFWSIHVYATDHSEAAAPFIAQTSLQNLYYSPVDTNSVVTVNADNTMTVSNPNWGSIVSSTPIRFSDNAADYGLMPNTVYYAVCLDNSCPNTDDPTTSTFEVSAQWQQPLSSATPYPVPIQGPGGSPGPIVALPSPSPGASPLQYGMVKPVTQLGSTQLVANQLVLNPDNSLTLWFGPGPTPPANAPASNWIPTPNTAYYQPIYNQQISTNFQLTLRMYYPQTTPPSILLCPSCTPPSGGLPETYVPPTVECVSGPTCP